MLNYALLNVDLEDKRTILKIIRSNTDRIDGLNNKQNAIEHMLIDLWKYFN